MGLETRNIGQALRGKQYVREQEKRAEITQDNNQIDDNEKGGVIGFINSKISP